MKDAKWAGDGRRGVRDDGRRRRVVQAGLLMDSAVRPTMQTEVVEFTKASFARRSDGPIAARRLLRRAATTRSLRAKVYHREQSC